MSDELPRIDVRLEQEVLGTLMLFPASVPLVLSTLRVAHFSDPRNAEVFRSIEACNERGYPIDISAVALDLRERQRLSTAGGVAYLSELSDSVATSAHVEEQAAMLGRLARARSTGRVLQEMLARYRDPRVPLSEFEAASSALGVDTAPVEDAMTPRSYEQLAEVFYKRLEDIGSGAYVPTVRRSGFRDLDRLLLGGGFDASQFVLIAARPSMGKSSLAMQMATTMSAEGAVVVFSLEMRSAAQFERVVAGATGIDSQLLRTGALSPEQWRAVQQGIGRLWDKPVWLLDNTRITLRQIRTVCRSIKAKYAQAGRRLAAVMVDYLGLVTSEGEGNEKNREREISELSRGLKILAGELDCPVFGLSQLNRQCEARQDKRPMNSDLRDSGSLEQDADTILFVYRDEMYDKESPDRGIAEVIIGKQREGPRGTARLAFDGATTSFRDLDEEPQAVVMQSQVEPDVNHQEPSGDSQDDWNY